MRYLKNVFYRLRQYMSIQNNQPVIPEVLRTRLWTAASMIACVMAVGIFMEYQLGDGFLKLSCLCSICLGIRFFDLLLIIYDRKYEVVEGEVVRIRICGIQKKHWEITVRNQQGEEKTVFISEQSNIRKGRHYRIYSKKEAILGIEEQGI